MGRIKIQYFKSFFSLGLLFISMNVVKSQTPEIQSKLDSLNKALKLETNDSLYGEILSDIAFVFLYEIADGIDSAEVYAKKTAQWGNEKKVSIIEVYGNELLGAIYRDRQEKEKCLNYYNKAYELSLAAGDTLKSVKMRGNIATAYTTFGEYEKAIETKLQNIDYFVEKQDSYALMVDYYGIGHAYGAAQTNDKALEYFLKASLYGQHPLVYGAIGRSFSRDGQLDSAYHYLNIGLEKAQKGSGVETDLLQKLASVYREEGKFEESIELFEKALNNLGNDSQLDLALRVKHNLTASYLEVGDNKKARATFNNIVLMEDSKADVAQYYETKTKLLEAEGKYRASLEAYKLFHAASDSLSNAELKGKVEEIETKYETEKKDIEIENLSLKDEMNNDKIHQQRRTITLGGIGLGLITLLSFFLFRLYKKVNSQKEIISKSLSEKDLLLREIHHRVKNNLQLVSSLLTLQGRSIDDKQAQQAINEGKSRVRSMALIHQDLYNKENLTDIGVKNYLDKLTSELFATYSVDKDQITLDLTIEDIDLDVDTLIPLGLIINELVTNSLKYAWSEGERGVLKIGLKKEIDIIKVTVKDNGVGYDSTKARSGSFGSTLINALTQQIEGELSIDTNGGTKVEITIPHQ